MLEEAAPEKEHLVGVVDPAAEVRLDGAAEPESGSRRSRTLVGYSGSGTVLINAGMYVRTHEKINIQKCRTGYTQYERR